jgi:hypothetical protein
VSIFQFQPRWKEELIVTGPGGSFTLEHPMGKRSVYLPDEHGWVRNAPPWCANLWPILYSELQTYCTQEGIDFYVEAGSWVDFA